MSSIVQAPDYELEDLRVVSSPRELRAMAHPLRATILDLLLERAATVGELAAAVGRPPGTVAHHVGVLADAGMLKVVRTRRVRAIDERFYGRTARIFYVGVIRPEQARMLTNNLSVAAAESEPAHQADDLRAIIRHARIPRELAASSSSPTSSRACRALARPSTDSLPGSTRPTTPPCPNRTRRPAPPVSRIQDAEQALWGTQGPNPKIYGLPLDRVPRGLGRVVPSRRGGPGEGAVGVLVGLPSRGLA